MAQLVDFFCSRCHKQKTVSLGALGASEAFPSVCYDCKEKECTEAKKSFLDERRTLPMERRVALLEEAEYDRTRQEAMPTRFRGDEMIGGAS